MEHTSCIADDVEIYNPGGLSIGHHAIISQGAYICGATHDINSREFTFQAKPIQLAPYSWVCARAVVLPGVTLRDGAVLGAAGVAAKDLAAWTVYGGNPAKVIGQRARSHQ